MGDFGIGRKEIGKNENWEILELEEKKWEKMKIGRFWNWKKRNGKKRKLGDF